LLRGHRSYLGFDGVRGINQGSDIASDEAPLMSLPQCTPENGSKILNGARGEPFYRICLFLLHGAAREPVVKKCLDMLRPELQKGPGVLVAV